MLAFVKVEVVKIEVREFGLYLNPGLPNELGMRGEKERKIKNKFYYLENERLSRGGEKQV